MKKLALLAFLAFFFVVGCQKEEISSPLNLAKKNSFKVSDPNPTTEIQQFNQKENVMIPYHDIDYVVNYRYCKFNQLTSWNGVKIYLTALTKYWYPQGIIGIYKLVGNNWVLIKQKAYTSSPIAIWDSPLVFPNGGPYLAVGIASSGTLWPTIPSNLPPAGSEQFYMNQAGQKCLEEAVELQVDKE